MEARRARVLRIGKEQGVGDGGASVSFGERGGGVIGEFRFLSCAERRQGNMFKN